MRITEHKVSSGNILTLFMTNGCFLPDLVEKKTANMRVMVPLNCPRGPASVHTFYAEHIQINGPK